MRLKQFSKFLAYYSQFIPFTRNSILLVLLLLLIKPTLAPKLTKELLEDKHLPLIQIMGRFVFGLLLILLCISILSTCYAWLRCKFFNVAPSVQLTKVNDLNHTSTFELQLFAILKPLLGQLKFKFYYEQQALGEKYNVKDKFFNWLFFKRSNYKTLVPIELPHIKDYPIDSVLLYFEDSLNLISLVIKLPLNQYLNRPPENISIQTKHPQPQINDHNNIRIEQLKRVEGDYLNQKNFEEGDDVRRIIWKIYAKNKNLVLRTPETLEPFASTLFCYASFYTQYFQNIIHLNYADYLLDDYKNHIWSLLQQLNTEKIPFMFQSDQSQQRTENPMALDEYMQEIRNATWQYQHKLSASMHANKNRLWIISSLCPAQEVKQLLENKSNADAIYYVKLSNCLQQNQAWSWFKWLLFTETKNNSLAKLKRKWYFSNLRKQVLKNEKQIESLLDIETTR